MKHETDSYDDWVISRLAKNPKLAREYLSTILKDSIAHNDSQVFLRALKQVVASQGIGNVAKSAGVRRESLSRSLSAKGNPRIDTLFSIINAIGLQLTIKPTRKAKAIHA